MIFREALVGLVAAVLGVAGVTSAQASHHTVLLVGVGDAESGAFVPNAQVRITSLSRAVVSDDMGRAILSDVPAGTYVVEARRIGYSPLTAPVKIGAEDSLEVVMLLQPVPRTLDTVTVRDRSVPPGLQEFDNRMRKGIGHYVTGAQLDSAPNRELADIVISRFAGVRIEGMPGVDEKVFSLRGNTSTKGAGGCEVLVFLDGVHLVDGDVSFIRPADLAGIEYYTDSQIPPQYRTSGSLRDAGSPACGVMLLWTKR